MNSTGKRFLLVAILLLPVLWGVFNFLVKPVAIELPYYGQKTPTGKGDTIFQTIEEFSFVDQNNSVITQDSIKGKITVVNYFFTTCTGVCPRMNTSLLYIAKRFEKSNEVKMLSHTVNPESDSVAALKQYVINRQWDNNPIWHFLTGNKKQLYEMAEYSYLLIADGASKEEFVHSDKVIVLDGLGHVRGIFDGMGGNMEMKKIEDAIKVLIIEKRANAKEKKQ
jgi:protein SCO1/2